MAKYALEATPLWICGQFSAGLTPNPSSKKKISGDGAFRKDRGEDCFWAVATPL